MQLFVIATNHSIMTCAPSHRWSSVAYQTHAHHLRTSILQPKSIWRKLLYLHCLQKFRDLSKQNMKVWRVRDGGIGWWQKELCMCQENISNSSTIDTYWHFQGSFPCGSLTSSCWVSVTLRFFRPLLRKHSLSSPGCELFESKWPQVGFDDSLL